MATGLPQGFEHLQHLVDEWALESQGQREMKRRASSPAMLTQFFEAILPELEDILRECDKYAIGKLPETHQPLFNLSLMLAEVAPHVEHYGASPKVPHSFEESRMIASHADHATWKG